MCCNSAFSLKPSTFPPTTLFQAFRTAIDGKQPDVDAVLSLGRTILTSPHTSADNQPFEKRLTDSIEAWSELQLGWQNWYQELMAASERSSAVSDRYGSFSDWLAQARSKLGSTFPLRVGPASAPADVEEAQVSCLHFCEELCEFCSVAFERDLDVRLYCMW